MRTMMMMATQDIHTLHVSLTRTSVFHGGRMLWAGFVRCCSAE